MKKKQIQMEEKLTLFQELISCNYKVDFFTYDANMNFLTSNSQSPNLFDALFSASKNNEFLLSYMETQSLPVVLSDSFGIIWIACFEKQGDIVSKVHMIGPVYNSDNSFQNIKVQIDNHDFSIKLRKMVLEQLQGIPIISSSLFFQYAIMLHYCLTGEKLTNSDMQYASSNFNVVCADTLDSSKQHQGIWATEQKLISMVEHGNLDYQNTLSDSASMSHGVRINVGDPIRQAKNSVISFITLCTRAAIRGGLPSDTAYNLTDFYIQNLEYAKSISEIGVISHTMYDDFIRRVHKIKQNQDISLPIRSCQDYIQAHLCEKIQVKDLADMLGYSDYYLTKKFKKELGMSINVYIQNARIEHAKLLLSTTKDSIQTISDTLCFCSRSYFSDTFQKITGVSPSDYREENFR